MFDILFKREAKKSEPEVLQRTKEEKDDKQLKKIEKIDKAIADDIHSYTLDSGSEVTESKFLKGWIHDWRTTAVNRYQSYDDSIKSTKADIKQKTETTNEYIHTKLFNNTYENEMNLIPGTTISLLAFFTGRILTNKNNWSRISGSLTKSSYSAKLLTSIPSRIILPFLLFGYSFKTYLPVTYNNTIHMLENDIMPKDYVDKYHQVWEDIYPNYVLKSYRTISNKVDELSIKTVQKVRGILENIIY